MPVEKHDDTVMVLDTDKDVDIDMHMGKEFAACKLMIIKRNSMRQSELRQRHDQLHLLFPPQYQCQLHHKLHEQYQQRLPYHNQKRHSSKQYEMGTLQQSERLDQKK
jgi:hypothetical protein